MTVSFTANGDRRICGTDWNYSHTKIGVAHVTPDFLFTQFTYDEFDSLQQTTSDQPGEFGAARQTRDCEDTKKILDYLSNSNPFQENQDTLRNIATVVQVNIGDAKAVGEKILEKMKGKYVKSFTCEMY